MYSGTIILYAHPNKNNNKISQRGFMVSRVIILGGGVAGCGAALEIANTGEDEVVLVEALDELMSATSDRTPCRLGLGFHYIDPETALKNLEATLAFVRQYPGFRLGEQYSAYHPLRRCRYFVVRNSHFSVDQVLKTYEALKEAYRQACQKDSRNEVFGNPDGFYRILQPAEYEQETHADQILIGIDTAECILDWQNFKAFMIRSLLQHPRIKVYLNTEVTDVRPQASAGSPYFMLQCQRKKETFILAGDVVINATWHNIEKMNAQMGITDPYMHRTQRLKAMAEVTLPERLLRSHSAVFCFGPHASFTNLETGRGYVTYEPVTNVVSTTELALSEYAEKLLLRNKTCQEETMRIGQAILSGACTYLPDLAQAQLKNVHFGIVRNFGEADIYDAHSPVHLRRESGVEERALSYVINETKESTF